MLREVSWQLLSVASRTINGKPSYYNNTKYWYGYYSRLVTESHLATTSTIRPPFHSDQFLVDSKHNSDLHSTPDLGSNVVVQKYHFKEASLHAE